MTPAPSLPLDALERIDAACDQFEQAWRTGPRPDLADFLAGDGEERRELFRALLELELEYRLKAGDAPTAEEYRRRFPDDDATAVFAGVSRDLVTVGTGRAVLAHGPPLAVPGYELLGRLGGGGMGVVYKARHLRLGRVVALKMIRSGEQASAAERDRFRTEALAAARLQHPNVVQVFEVGEANGQPFLCMEYVEGDSLAGWIDGTPWPAGRAAGMVETLARAVEEAHRHGIVHRDLKPSNVLLNGYRPAPGGSTERTGSSAVHPSAGLTPKVTDFGLAKLAEGGLGRTETGVFLGSPCYASPEQAGAHRGAIGPHTDIYALGAVLYELLTGRPPFRGATLMDTIRQVLEREPAPPRLLNPAVPPDLEAVCLKCLEKAPGRRYAKAADLADDLGRWQRHEPTRAYRPGALGRAARWCRRHPAATTIAAVVALAVGGVVWQWREAVAAGYLAEQRRIDAEAAQSTAEEEAAAAREVAAFLGGLLEEADPFVITPRAFGDQPDTNPRMLDILDRAGKRLADPGLIRHKPLVRAALLDKVGHAYASLGEGAKAAPFVTEALALRRAHLAGDHPDLAASLHTAGFLALTRHELRRSADLFAAAHEMRTRLFGADSPEAVTSRSHLAFARVALNDPAAGPLLQEVLASQRAELTAAAARGPAGSEATELAFTLITACNYHMSQDRPLDALPYLTEAQGVLRKVPNPELAALADHFLRYRRDQALRRVDPAARALRTALGLVERASGRHHYMYWVLQQELGSLYFEHGRYAEAEAVYQECEANYRRSVGPGPGLAHIHYELARSITRGAFATTAPDRRAELVSRVERLARSAYELVREAEGEEKNLGFYATFLAHVYLNMKAPPDYPAAEAVARDGVLAREREYGVGHPLTSHPRAFLLRALAGQGKAAEIEHLLRDLLARDPKPRWDENAREALPPAARCLARAGKPEAAVIALEQATRNGHYDWKMVATDPDLAAVRDRPEFRQPVEKRPE